MNNAVLNAILREVLHAPTATSSSKSKKRKAAVEVQAAFFAIQQGDLIRLSKLVRTPKQANWRKPDQGWCLLDEAVKSGSLSMVTWLLQHGANPNTLFCGDEPHAHTLQPLPGLYFSPFASAISEGHVEIAKMLFRCGASLDLPFWCHSDGSIQTCREMAQEREMWPHLEAAMLHEVVPQGTPVAIAEPKRL